MAEEEEEMLFWTCVGIIRFNWWCINCFLLQSHPIFSV